MEYHEDDLILCTVESIVGTTVFVSMPDGKKGTIVTSEIAAGRIRNLRDYVVPKKKIVCKVLRIAGSHIDLSLRRVNSKEKKEVMEKHKQEQTAKSAIHSILKEDAQKAQEEILSNFANLSEFLISAKEDEKLIDKYIPKKYHEQIKKITQKKKKQIEVKQNIKLKCLEADGLNKIKALLASEENIKIHYLSAGRFSLTIKHDDYKSANKILDNFLETLEKNAKSSKCEFEIIEKR